MANTHEFGLGFISDQDFIAHVAETILHYGSKLAPVGVKKFNSNIIDPVKMVLDRAVYGMSWEELITSEIARQREKSNTNEIGYFHQRLFAYLDNCEVPTSGWDVVFTPVDGYQLDDFNRVSRIYVEMKNKHNTMNSAASQRTYMKMQGQLLAEDNCACMLVEVLAPVSRNITWVSSVDGQRQQHSRIRRVSIDHFYSLVTGQEDAFFQVCMALPKAVEIVLENPKASFSKPNDSVVEELKSVAERLSKNFSMSFDDSMLLAMYFLGFGDYFGFSELKQNYS